MDIVSVPGGGGGHHIYGGVGMVVLSFKSKNQCFGIFYGLSFLFLTLIDQRIYKNPFINLTL